MIYEVFSAFVLCEWESHGYFFTKEKARNKIKRLKKTRNNLVLYKIRPIKVK